MARLPADNVLFVEAKLAAERLLAMGDDALRHPSIALLLAFYAPSPLWDPLGRRRDTLHPSLLADAPLSLGAPSVTPG